MIEPRHEKTPERIDLARADDPRDVVHRSVAALAQGEGLVLSVGGLHGLAASALHPDAVGLLRDDPGDPGDGADAGGPWLLVNGGDELADWAPDLSLAGVRMARRGWPGPLTLLLPEASGPSLFDRLPAGVSDYVRAGGAAAFHSPPDPFVRDVLRLLPGPIVFRPAGSAPPEPAAGFALMVESTAGPAGDAPTVVRVDPGGWSVVRPGGYDGPTLTRLAGTVFLFVCTGNTCRSPMAEALCKVVLAERLGCAAGELEARGFVVLSAGIAAASGAPAAANAVDVVRARGGSLEAHASRRLTYELVAHADHILAMTGDHLEVLVENVPAAAPRTRLLHPEGYDVADPVGADRATYQRTAAAIEAYLKPLLDALGL